MNPLIGITPSPSQDEMAHGSFYRYCLSRAYVDGVRAAGGTPVILPTDSANVSDILDRLDGLLLSGGGDIHPSCYGDPSINDATYGIDADRDRFELAAFRLAATRDLPTLCICRGVQSMAVAMGGTLIQDIPSQVPGALEHRQHLIGKMRDDVSHEVRITPGNPLFDAIGGQSLMTNSFHHQAIQSAGHDLRIIAIAEDGIVEALWHPAMTFGIGVQWHPELLAPWMPEHASLFRLFVDAARAHTHAV